MAGRIEGRDLATQLEEVDRRLDRLERLAFLGFQDTRDVARYAYENLYVDPETAKPISWKQSGFRPLSDQEAAEVAGLAMHELVALKMTMRTLRKQTRRDALGVLRDLVRRGAKQTDSAKEAA